MKKYKKIYCKNCNQLLNKHACYNKNKRCHFCAQKKRFKNYKNHPMLGRKHSVKTRKKISDAVKSKNHPRYGKKLHLKIRKKISESTKYENHYNWQGGISFEPYDIRFNEAYKETIRFRDHYKCQLCGCPQIENIKKLSIHHIDYNKMNTIPNNNISLCIRCNSKVNFNREYWKKYFRKLIHLILKKEGKWKDH